MNTKNCDQCTTLIAITSSFVHLVWQGIDRWFCSEDCKKKFVISKYDKHGVQNDCEC